MLRLADIGSMHDALLRPGGCQRLHCCARGAVGEARSDDRALGPMNYALLGLRGTPIWKPAPEKKRVFVTIEPRDGSSVQIRLWRGWAVTNIRRAAHETYPTADQ